MTNDGYQKSILITVDVEDWFQVENLRSVYPQESWDRCESRVRSNTEKILDLFDQYEIKGTFFVLGWTAQKYPDLVRAIHERGHEVASHGHWHTLANMLSKETLRDNAARSKAILEDITGYQVVGYRAPSFSITQTMLESLKALGFQYDSSLNDFYLNKRYGQVEGVWNSASEKCMIAKNGLIEIPVSNLKIGRFTLPWAGGGYFRFWPSWLFQRGVSRILREKGIYVFYCHPWEIDPAQPRVNGIGMLSGFRHYLNLDKTLTRLQNLFTTFRGERFISCSSYLRLIGLG